MLRAKIIVADERRVAPLYPDATYTPTSILNHEKGEENDRLDDRVQEAVADPTGRLKLYLNSSHATRLHDDIGRVKSLRELYCYNNPNLTTLPVTITRLASTLQVLDASHCGLTSLPAELADLRCLRQLDLSHNKLTAIVWDCDVLASTLEEFNIGHNKLRSLPPSSLKLMRSLHGRYQRLSKAMLHPPQCLVLAPNDFVTSTEHMLRPRYFDETGRADYNVLLGRELFPDSVECCWVCNKQVIVGRPVAHVSFVDVQTSLDKGDFDDAATRSSGFGVGGGSETGSVVSGMTGGNTERSVASSTMHRTSIQVPMLYPMCGAPECSIKLHKELHFHRVSGELSFMDDANAPSSTNVQRVTNM